MREEEYTRMEFSDDFHLGDEVNGLFGPKGRLAAVVKERSKTHVVVQMSLSAAAQAFRSIHQGTYEDGTDTSVQFYVVEKPVVELV